MTLFDLMAGLLLLVSGLTAFARGGVREVVGIVSLVAAALLAIMALKVTAPVARGMMSPDWAAVAAALLVVFVVVYVILRLIGGQISRNVQNAGALGALDRIIGLGMGLFRALIVLGTFSLLLEMASGSAGPPAWVRTATLYPLTQGAARVLKAFAPDGFAAAGKIAPAVGDAVKAGAGYSNETRDAMDDLVEKTR